MCMGSGSENVAGAEARGDRGDRREHSRLSRRMVILMNSSNVLPHRGRPVLTVIQLTIPFDTAVSAARSPIRFAEG